MSFLAILGSVITLCLWAMGSGRRLQLVKERISRDWQVVCHHLETRQHLIFKLGELEAGVMEAHAEVMEALRKVQEGGGPLKCRLKALQEAERKLTRLLDRELEGAQDRLRFALETYNDGVRLLSRLKRALFHWPAALILCPRRVDLFEVGSPPEGGTVTLKFEG